MPPITINHPALWGVPTSQRICLPFENLKNVCMKVPTVEGLKLVLVRLHREILVEHPYLSAAGLLFIAFFPTSPFYLIYYILYAIPREIAFSFLACLGFERRGVRAGSPASWYQSTYYGPHTPSNSFFSHSQSYGTVGRTRPSRSGGGDEVGSTLSKWFWRFIGCLCAYASIVVLLKYGGSS
ncbi:hypothetical protein BJ165DRAFT_1499187 [Panaeolus papilionaceus]|nr:hypothetical protein BJ165DRAFT_1499187 [Panaeolus papilionaceus]